MALVTDAGAILLTGAAAVVVAIWGVISQRNIARRQHTMEHMAATDNDRDMIDARRIFITEAKKPGGLTVYAEDDKEHSTEAAAICYGLVKQGAYSQDAADQTADYAERASRQIQQPCIRLAAPEKAQCLAHEISEYELKTRDNRREYDDLVAQRKSALWTFIMGLAALIGMALSVLGVILVKVTFDETRKTNRIALREGARSTRRAIASAAETEAALGIARESADAANRQAEIAEDTAKRQLRAYVTTTKHRISGIEPDQTPEFSFEIKNVGQTPASEVRVWAELFLPPHWRAASDTKVRFKLDVKDQSTTVAAPGEPALSGFKFDGPINLEQANGLKSGTQSLGVFGVVSYRDIFHRRHFTTFKLFVHPHWFEANGVARLMACNKGNRAN